ncbi:hypothetical protein F5141DRAFT_682858 [Pisolithus sp. B1]|nr:hypothetical protein F5141DRAFT_682858 [Pisolithus sp. B1]
MGLFDLFRGSKKTSAILPTDIVVFIVGPSGSGKSWFMSVLLKNAQVRVSKGQKPGTTEIHAERCRFDGMKNDIVVVDTPSFDNYDGPDGETEVKRWMDSNYTKPCKAAGVLYMHNIASNPNDPGLKVSNHLGTFRRTCRQNLVPSVIHVVPTLDHGARLPQERIMTRVTQLELQANSEGAQLCNASSAGYTFDGRPGTAWDIVQGLLSRWNLR